MSVHVIGLAKHGTTLLDGVQNSSISPNIENMILGGDGKVYNDFIAVGEQKPVASLETIKCAAWLDHIGVGGLSVGANPLELYFQEVDPYGTRETTGEKMNIPQGLIIPRTLSANQGVDPASLACDVVMVRDGANAPFAASSGETTPTGNSVDEAFGLGGVTVNGTSIGPVQSASVDFGIAEVTISGDGDLQPTLVYIERYNPSITITTYDATQMVALSELGDEQPMVVTFRKREGDGYASAGDITITTTLSRVFVTELGGSHDGQAQSQITCQTAYDGTNHPITYSLTT